MNPLDHCFAEARAAGVTTVMTSPGSANACGGTMAILKTAGRMADRMQIGTGVKFALGENPKSVYNDRDETPITRMATAIGGRRLSDTRTPTRRNHAPFAAS